MRLALYSFGIAMIVVVWVQRYEEIRKHHTFRNRKVTPLVTKQRHLSQKFGTFRNYS